MIDLLIHRLEAAAGPDIELDCDLMDWIGTLPEIGRTDRWLRHSLGLVHCLSGAKRLLDDLFPGARWHVGAQFGATSVTLASVSPHGFTLPHVGTSHVEGAALLAATLRAYAAARGRTLAANDSRSIA